MKAIPVILILIFPRGLEAEEFLWQRMLKAPEAEQVAFVKSFIADDLRKVPIVDGDERRDAMVTLMLNRGDTFIPLFEQAVQSEVKSDVALSNGIVYRAVGAISNARSELALETIERLFRDDKVRFDRYISLALPSCMSGNKDDRRKAFLIWYKALDSPNPNLRAAATFVVQRYLGYRIAWEDVLEPLTEAMASRYGHLPEESDFRSDPLIAAIEFESMTIAYETRRKVTEISDGMRRKKALESKSSK